MKYLQAALGFFPQPWKCFLTHMKGFVSTSAPSRAPQCLKVSDMEYWANTSLQNRGCRVQVRQEGPCDGKRSIATSFQCKIMNALHYSK